MILCKALSLIKKFKPLVEMIGQGSEKHLVFRIIEYGANRSYFTLPELFEHLQVDRLTQNYITVTLSARNTEPSNANQILVLVDGTLNGDIHKDRFTVLPNAILQYIDYLEIVEAKKTAKEANNNSMLALTVSVVAIVLSMVIGLGALVFQLVDLVHHWNDH